MKNNWLLPSTLVSIEIQHILAHINELQRYDSEWGLCSNEALPDIEDYMEMASTPDSVPTTIVGTDELLENDISDDEFSRIDTGTISFGGSS